MGFNFPGSYAAIFKDTDFKAQLVVKGLTRPTGMIFLDENDILVTEKRGIVQRIIGEQIVPSPVLDITKIVNTTIERGLLSIGISHSKDSGGKYNNDNAPSIYLLFTQDVGKNTTDNFNCVHEKCESSQNVVNSLYRYKFKDGELITPKLLANVPLYSNESTQHIGGALNVGPDNKIYFTTGDGKGCEYFEDCAIKTSYFSNETESNSTGGIYFLTDNSETNDFNETSSDKYYQYAYGIRNSFGLDFDPLTGNLWDTENGPAFGDEINLVKPGFDSGWPRLQGIWSVTNYSQVFNNPPPGLPKGYYFTETPQTPDHINGKGNYSDPEFTWNQTLGVTSLVFFNSNKYGSQYENGVFVATFNGAIIYHFDLNKDRDQFSLNGPIKDKVANNNQEMGDVIFVKGLGLEGLGSIGITDLEVSPDGYLYVLTYGPQGAIYKIVPKEQD